MSLVCPVQAILSWRDLSLIVERPFTRGSEGAGPDDGSKRLDSGTAPSSGAGVHGADDSGSFDEFELAIQVSRCDGWGSGWQADPVEKRLNRRRRSEGSNDLHLPEAIAGRTLLRNLEHTTAFSPNGDGVNDQYKLSLTVVKTNREPTIRLFDLAGQLVVELQNQSLETRRGHYIWGGRHEEHMMPLGVYVLQIEVASNARTERVQKTVNLV